MHSVKLGYTKFLSSIKILHYCADIKLGD